MRDPPSNTGRRSLLIGGAAAACWPSWTRAQGLPSPAQLSTSGTDAEARASVVDLLRSLVGDMERPLTGISVAWLQGESRVSRAWAGWRSIGAEHPGGSLPIESGTLYRTASLAKLAMALVALRLHEARVLDLDEDLSGALRHHLRHPQYPNTAITPRLLLSHRSGLLDNVSLPLADGEALRRRLAAPATWGAQEPGRWFRYSNLGSVVLATAMETAGRQPFDALMQRWLFDPLGLTCRYSVGALSTAQREGLATLYRRPDRSAVWVPQADARDDVSATSSTPSAALLAIGDNASVHAPHSGLRISVPDLARLTRLLMQQGRWEGRRLFSNDSWQQMVRPHWQLSAATPGDTLGGLFRGWGLGLQAFTDSSDAQGGDRLHPRGGWRGHGHVGIANGLLAGLMFQSAGDARAPWGLVYVINGTSQGAAETPGRYSSFRRCEERVIESLLDTIAATKDTA